MAREFYANDFLVIIAGDRSARKRRRFAVAAASSGWPGWQSRARRAPYRACPLGSSIVYSAVDSIFERLENELLHLRGRRAGILRGDDNDDRKRDVRPIDSVDRIERDESEGGSPMNAIAVMIGR
jgi:hypothetical protein